MGQHLAAGRGQCGCGRAVVQRAVLGIQALVAALAGEELGQAWAGLGGVGGAQLRRIHATWLRWLTAPQARPSRSVATAQDHAIEGVVVGGHIWAHRRASSAPVRRRFRSCIDRRGATWSGLDGGRKAIRPSNCSKGLFMANDIEQPRKSAKGSQEGKRPWTQTPPVAARSAASMVLTSNMVMVIGPTPPGTGRDPAGHVLHAVKIDVAAQLAGLVPVHPHVNHHRAGFDHVGREHLALAHCGHHHVGLPSVEAPGRWCRCGTQ